MGAVGAGLLLCGIIQSGAGAQAQNLPGLPSLSPNGMQRNAGGVRAAPPRSEFSDRPVTLHSKGDLRTALDALFAALPVNYVYALRVLPLNSRPVDLIGVTFDTAFREILQDYPAIPPIRAHLAGRVLSLIQNDPPGQKPDVMARKVTLRLKDAPVQDAFHALFAALGTDYTLDYTLTGTVTLSGRDMTAHQVVYALVKQISEPLRVVERGNIIIIRRVGKQAAQPAPAGIGK